MASQSSNETNEQNSHEDLPSINEQHSTEASTSEDHTQRKRSRVGSHPDEDNQTTANNDNTNEIINETSSSPTENRDTSDTNKTANSTGPVKRRRLNIDIEEIIEQDEKTNDSVQTTTTTTTNESKGESSTTATTTTTDEDDDDDDDDKKIEYEDDDEEDDDNENEQNKLPPTTNTYLRLRQRELGIFDRSRPRTTCRAFHDNTIASRSLVQRMKVSHTLDAHNGCVNALAFNRTGK
jgi:hypothetical protein